MSQRDENNKFETEQKGRLVLKWIGYEQIPKDSAWIPTVEKKEREKHTSLLQLIGPKAPPIYISIVRNAKPFNIEKS